MKPLCVIAFAAASLISASSLAETINKALTIKARVPTTLDWKRADGSALHGELEMKYLVGVGLNLEPISTKIHSNHPTANFNVSLASDTVELVANNGSRHSVALDIALNNTKLSTIPTHLEASELFPNGVSKDQAASKELPLKITQTTPGVLTPGDYVGTVNLILTHTL